MLGWGSSNSSTHTLIALQLLDVNVIIGVSIPLDVYRLYVSENWILKVAILVRMFCTHVSFGLRYDSV